MKQSERPKASKREDRVDFISKMPDGILVSILSCLPDTEEVIRSSILSRRWRYLWTSIPSLVINCYNKNFEKSKFQEFVYWVLVNRSADLNRFALHCSNHYSMSTVARWIHVAVTKNVKELNLSFCPKEKTEDIELPHCLVTCGSLEVLGLRSAIYCSRLRLPNSTGFPKLRVLVLTAVDLLENKDLVQSFFESCPLLESLILINCVMNKEPDLFRISCPNLTFLKIQNNGRKLMRGGIRISCPKLDSLEFVGRISNNIYFECLQSLKEAMIKPNWKRDNISVVLFPGISHVESLSIDLSLFLKCINGASDPGLPNLKRLVLSATMDAFTIDNLKTILKCYPKLEALKLHIEHDVDGNHEGLDKAETWKILTSDVKRIEFFEFNGEEPDLDWKWYSEKLEMYFYWGDQEHMLPAF